MFYYPGTAVGLTGQGLSWQRLEWRDDVVIDHPTGSKIELRSPRRSGWAGVSPRACVGPCRQALSFASIRTWTRFAILPEAAGGSTHRGPSHPLQPVALLHSHDALESALSHELLHVMVESQAARDLPVWFREGLVEFLSGQRIAADVRIPGDADLRQTTDAAAARRTCKRRRGNIESRANLRRNHSTRLG